MCVRLENTGDLMGMALDEGEGKSSSINTLSIALCASNCIPNMDEAAHRKAVLDAIERLLLSVRPPPQPATLAPVCAPRIVLTVQGP